MSVSATLAAKQSIPAVAAWEELRRHQTRRSERTAKAFKPRAGQTWPARQPHREGCGSTTSTSPCPTR
jgi:hypothetical protein